MTKLKPDKPKTAIVIGAGAGGIATAARLAHSGLQVTVLEKNTFTGGRCSTLRAGPYRFDQGPSLLLLPQLFHRTFADLDTSLAAEGVELLRCAPLNYAIYFADGEVFRQSSDLAIMKAEIERWEGEGGFARYLAWMGEGHRHYEISVREVLGRNFEGWGDMFNVRFLGDALRLHPWESMWRRASRYFWTERLRRVFTFSTMYMGMSPFEAPSTYSLLQYTELAEGIWYPKGGFHAILEALVRVGERLGVEYRLGCPVRKILSSEDGRRATGVVLESGETLSADIVVVNADLVYAYSNLFPPSAEISKYSQKLRNKDASCSSISFYWSLSKKIPELDTHNIFLADRYRESFDAIFKDHRLPSDPSFYINVPSRIDPTAAPSSGDAIIALVPIGHLQRSKNIDPPSSSDATADSLTSRARAAVLATISARTGCPPLSQFITHEMVNTPLTWEAKFNLDKGAILGLSHSFFNVLAFRPGTRARGPMRNVYFVGASTHPGTGVPIVLAGAKLTAEQVLREEVGLRAPWDGRDGVEGGSRGWGVGEWVVVVGVVVFLVFLVVLMLMGSGVNIAPAGDW